MPSLAHSIRPRPTPPAHDEIELSVFGPGTGEAILLHCGHGHWVAIDCARLDGRCWPLWYLAQIGVEPSALKLIVISHWHNDHISGLSELLSAAGNATVAFSNAIQTQEFRQLLATFNAAVRGNNRSKVDEITLCMELIQQRLNASTPPVHLAQQHLPLMDATISEGVRATAVALSPSTLDIIDARTSFDELSALGIDKRPKPLSASSPNHASVVVYVQINENSIILAADRETRNHAGKGWEVIVGNPISNQVPADALKVAHHGSPNGFYSGLWPGLIVPDSVGVVTPFARHNLPEPGTLRQYLAKGMRLYATAWPHTRARWRLPLSPSAKINRPRQMEPGMVSLRKMILNGTWQPQLLGGATAVDEALLSGR
jgi:metallo-beta-lactamase superfamily protein